jgi:preprotein translocase subunit SecE
LRVQFLPPVQPNHVGVNSFQSVAHQANLTSSASLMKQSIGTYIREVGNEMKKVSWPKRDQLIESTIITIVVCLIITMFVYAIDIIFTWLFSLFF